MPKKSSAKKKTSVQAKTKSSVSPKARQIKKPDYRSFRLAKRIKHHKGQLPNSFKLLRSATGLLWRNKKLFAGILIIYSLLTFAVVQGFGLSLGIQPLKDSLSEVARGQLGGVVTGLTLFEYLVNSAGSTSSEGGGVYQLFFLTLFSLVAIWSLRQLYAGKAIRLKSAFYSSTYPLIPFVLVLGVIGLQLLPLLAGKWLYSLAIDGGIAVLTIEKLLWAIFFGLLALLSLYMMASSLFAMYIVTLPDMKPMAALRSARELVRYRRWQVMRKIIALPIMLLLLGALIMIPTIVFLTPVAESLFFLLNMAVLVIVHAYMYALYRELL